MDAVEILKGFDDVVPGLVAEVVGGHAHFKIGADCAGAFKEIEQPQWLHPGALGIQIWWRHCHITDNFADLPTDAIDYVAALAVIILNNRQAALDKLTFRTLAGQLGMPHVRFGKPQQGRHCSCDLFLGKMEIGHAQFCVMGLNGMPVENARVGQFGFEPVIIGMAYFMN